MEQLDYNLLFRWFVGLSMDDPLILGETRARVQASVDAIPSATKAFIEASLVAGTPEDAIAYYQGLAEAGIQYFIPTILGLDVETVELLANRAIPAVVAP
jgi:hypothetical protein